MGARKKKGESQLEHILPLEQWPEELAQQISERMGELDPQAEIVLQLQCPSCRHHFTTAFDSGEYFFRELSARQDRRYREVHQLAFAYHWSEADILSMSPRKRQRYLDLLAENLVSDFLYRMVQRAAGAPDMAPTPQPPRRFHWPAVVDSPLIRSNTSRPPLNPTLPGDELADSVSSRVEQAREPALPEQDLTANAPVNLSSNHRITSLPAAEVKFSQATNSRTHPPAKDQTSEPSPQGQATPSPMSEAVTDRFYPSRRSPKDRPTQQHDSRAQYRPIGCNHRHTHQNRSHLPEGEVDSPAAGESAYRAIERAIAAVEGEALDTAPRPSRSAVPTKRDTWRSQQAHSVVASQRFASQPSPPPVEVKIGSVEIVFDPPATASQPAPARPVGFAEFVDLRRYATRPWPSRSR